mgnify:CR=1 FL=1
MKTSPKEQVLKYYPYAKCVNIGAKNGNYYHIYSNPTQMGHYLGQGKSKEQAWKAASRNLDI